MKKSDHPCNIGKERTLTAINKENVSFVIEDEIHCEQRGAAHEKLIYLQRLKILPTAASSIALPTTCGV